jgi:signal transduction histidine kinase
VGGAIVIHLVVSALLAERLGPSVDAFALLPVAVIGLYGGARAGLIAGLASFPVDLALRSATGPEGPAALIGQGAAARHLLIVIVGGGIGYAAQAGDLLTGRSSRSIREQSDLERETVMRNVLARVGRVLGSSLDPAATYPAFAALVRSAVRFDRLAVIVSSRAGGGLITEYESGTGADHPSLALSPGDEIELAESALAAGGAVRGVYGPTAAGESGGPSANAGSTVAVPFGSNGDLAGALALSTAHAEPYGGAEAMFLEEVAPLLGSAVANARLHTELELEARRREVLVDAARAFTEARSLDETLETLYEVLKYVTRFERFEVALFDDVSGSLTVRCVRGESIAGAEEGSAERWDPEWTGTRIGAAGRPQQDRAPFQDALEAAGMQSWIASPLRSRDRFVGVLTISSRSPRVHGPEDLELVRHLSDQIAPSVDSAAALEVERDLYHRLEVQNWDLLEARASVESAAGELRAKNEKLEAASKTRSTFLSMVSHELSTPLAIVNGFVELFMTTAGDRMSEREMEYLKVMQDNGIRLARLVDDLLDVARLESGRIGVEFEEFDGTEMVEEVVRSFEPIAGRRQQRIVADYGARGSRLRADRGRLSQVVTNLVSNALKYSGEGSAVYVRAARSPGWFELEVRDEGCGISEEDREKLFTAFFRSEEHRSQNIPGSGLGLVIAGSIIEIHGGSIEVVSEPGAGSTFRFSIPDRQRDAVRAPVAGPGSGPSSGPDSGPGSGNDAKAA